MQSVEVEYSVSAEKFIIKIDLPKSSIKVILTDTHGLNQLILKNLKKQLSMTYDGSIKTALIDTNNIPSSSKIVFSYSIDPKLIEIMGLSAGFYKKVKELSRLERILLFISIKIQQGVNNILIANAFEDLELTEIQKMIFILDEAIWTYPVVFILGTNGCFDKEALFYHGHSLYEIERRCRELNMENIEKKTDETDENLPILNKTDNLNDLSKKEADICKKIDFSIVNDHKVHILPFSFDLLSVYHKPYVVIEPSTMEVLKKFALVAARIAVFFGILRLCEISGKKNGETKPEIENIFNSVEFRRHVFPPIISSIFPFQKCIITRSVLLFVESVLFYDLGNRSCFSMCFALLNTHLMVLTHPLLLLSMFLLIFIRVFNENVLKFLLPISPVLYPIGYASLYTVILWLIILFSICIYYNRNK